MGEGIDAYVRTHMYTCIYTTYKSVGIRRVQVADF